MLKPGAFYRPTKTTAKTGPKQVIRDVMVPLIVDMAKAQTEAMRGMDPKAAFRHVRKIIDDNDVVFGVFQDHDSANGVGVKIIKGLPLVEAVATGGVTEMYRMAAVPCISPEQAFAVAEVLGDGPSMTN
jgi:hypothetical protein